MGRSKMPKVKENVGPKGHLLTDKLIERIADISSFLVADNVAAGSVGIDAKTFKEWKKRGKEDLDAGITDTPCAKLVLAIEQSQHIGHAKAVGNIYKSGPNGAMWLLKMRFPDQYSETQHIKVEIEKGLEAILDKANEVLPPEWFDVLMVALGAKVADASED